MSQDNFQSPKALGRFILREALSGSLATEGEGGYPFVSQVGVVALSNGTPLLLLSNLARHTLNIRKDPRVSLLLSERWQGPNLHEASSLTVTGRVSPAEKSEVRARYLVRHPEAAKSLDSADFSFWRLGVERGHLVAGFGKSADLTAEELLGSGTMQWPQG
jgi:putative heme iron utilization protein